ncbi:hypothetical protein FQZ97_763990 [compost metagenome]
MTAHCSICDPRQMTLEQRLELFGEHLLVLVEEFNQLREELGVEPEPSKKDDAKE